MDVRKGRVVAVNVLARAVAVAFAATVLSSGPSQGLPLSTRPELWVSRYNHTVDYGTALSVSSDGARLFVTGYSRSQQGDFDFATVAYAASSGQELWVARFDGLAQGEDLARALSISPDGTRVFVVGSSEGGTGSPTYAAVAYDSTNGQELWVARYDGPGEWDFAHGISVSLDGTKVFVTGESGGGGVALRAATLAYDAATGAELWVARYGGKGEASGRALAVSPDGARVFVTGEGFVSPNSSDYATVAYDVTTGAELWEAFYGGPEAEGWGNNRDYVRALSVSPDGASLFVTGESWGSGTSENVAMSASSGRDRLPPTEASFDYATVAYDAATGSRLWVARYDATGGHDGAWGIVVAPDAARVFVTGVSLGGPTSGWGDDYATLAYNASTGALLWQARYDGVLGAGDFAADLAIGPDGEVVYVTGGSWGGTPTSYDYATVAHDARTGIDLWVARYDGKPLLGNDNAHDVAISPNGGRVFVTGESWGNGTAYDFATAAYCTEPIVVPNIGCFPSAS